MTAREVYENCKDEFELTEVSEIEKELVKFLYEGRSMYERIVTSFDGPNYVLTMIGRGDDEAMCESGCDNCQFYGEDACANRVAEYLLQLVRESQRGSIEDLL